MCYPFILFNKKTYKNRGKGKKTSPNHKYILFMLSKYCPEVGTRCQKYLFLHTKLLYIGDN